MRTRAVLTIPLWCWAAATAQIPIPGASSSGAMQQAPVLMPAQTPQLDTFSGGAKVDKPVPGAIQLSILEAIQRGLKHNLGLLLSLEQS